MLDYSTARIGVSLLVATALLAVACGGDSSAEVADADSSATQDSTVAAIGEPSTTIGISTTTGSSTTATAPSTTTSLPPSTLAGGLVASSVRADVMGYIDYNNDPLQTLEEIAVLSAEQRDMVIHFYKVDDRYAAVFEGLDPDTVGCIFMSAFTESDGEFAQRHFSRAPLPNGHCRQLSDEIPNTESQGVQLCHGRVAYLSPFQADESIKSLGTNVDFLDMRPGGIIVGGGTGGNPGAELNERLPVADLAQISC